MADSGAVTTFNSAQAQRFHQVCVTGVFVEVETEGHD
jgi:hypothetical protein